MWEELNKYGKQLSSLIVGIFFGFWWVRSPIVDFDTFHIIGGGILVGFSIFTLLSILEWILDWIIAKLENWVFDKENKDGY